MTTHCTSSPCFHYIDIPSSNLGNVYIDDYSNYRIRKITASTGIITTIVGTGATGYNGDNIAATSATLYSPFGIAVDASGRVISNKATFYFG